MASNTLSSTREQIRQLEDARKLVLSEAKYYGQIVMSILPIMKSNSAVELRRWGAEFLAEAVSTPAVPPSMKTDLCLKTIGTLRDVVEEQNLDDIVLKSVIMAAASVYPLIVRWIATNPYDRENWAIMVAIKSRILQLWDTAPSPVKICCVKFAQRVVLAQTMSNGMEQKQSGLEVSLANIPQNHPLLDPRNLEAEATGLLDRMLSVLQDNSSDALLVDATLNTLSILIRTRPSTSTRILNAVLNFNPLKLANSPMTPKTRVLIKSMEKTTRMLLIHLAKRDPQNPMMLRIQQHIERLMRSRSEIFDEAGKKRAFAEAASGAADAKRLKMETPEAFHLDVKPLSPGPHSLGEIFTITKNPGLQRFDATQVPPALAARIAITALATIEPQLLEEAINGIRERFNTLSAVAQPALLNPDTSPLDVEDDDDDYEPDYYVAEDTEQILNKLDSAPREEPEAEGDSALDSLGRFKLPPPPRLDPDTAAQVGQVAVSRIFAPLATLGESSLVRRQRAGLNRLAASSYDRDSWLTVIIRLATRSNMGLEDADAVKIENDESASSLDRPQTTLSDRLREMLYTYVLEDFRRRIDVAIAWLCEEWYSDQLARREDVYLSGSAPPPQHYEKWAQRLVDGMLPYLTPQDKVLTRFLGEIPELNPSLLGRIKALCRDPSTVQLALTSLLYLVMMRPPAREIALDTVAGIWTEYEDARPLAAKYLQKWRPGFIESQSGSGGTSEGGGSDQAGGISGTGGGVSNVAIAT
ncbi:hypothetical protein VTK73DRAFT_2668 [Phialemonium thermophilum]|uniref:Symplekin/Pta1 N-terminal domain-containing protein n=1 Tax=Phialemonium thermophilum TaxID=223376 RepID=A0ABR3X334_9PEZI